ncbi:hypothetical protein ACOSQ2_032310 [Xanthoceras sorbifolium]
MLRGNPCNFTTFSTNALATLLAVKGCFNGIKWAPLLNRSTNTSIASNPWLLGSPSTKSMVKSSQICPGIGSGCSSPIGLRESYLTFWHVSHSATFFFTSTLSPSQ